MIPASQRIPLTADFILFPGQVLPRSDWRREQGESAHHRITVL